MTEAVIPIRYRSPVITSDSIRQSKLAVPVSIVIATLLASCGAPVPPSIVKQIEALPPASKAEMFPANSAGIRDTQLNRAVWREALLKYCRETGCDPKDLASRTTFSEKPDPAGKLKMETKPKESGTSMIIYNVPNITKCDGIHEATHIDTIPKDAPDNLGAALGIPGKIRFDGFAMTALSMSENKRALVLFEEAFADSMALWMGLLAGEKCDVGYGEIGYLMLAILEKGGIPYSEAIKLHQTSDLVGLLSKLTGETNYEVNFLFFSKVYTLIDQLKNKEITLENAIKEYETVSKAFKRKGTFRGNEFAQFFNEKATSSSMMNSIEYYAQDRAEIVPDEVYQYLPKLKKKDEPDDALTGTITFERTKPIALFSRQSRDRNAKMTDYSTRHTQRSNRRGKRH